MQFNVKNILKCIPAVLCKSSIHFFYKQLGSVPSPESRFYFQDFQGSKLLNNGCDKTGMTKQPKATHYKLKLSDTFQHSRAGSAAMKIPYFRHLSKTYIKTDIRINPACFIKLSVLYRSSHPEVFYIKAAFKHFAKFTEKNLCRSLFLRKRLQHLCFPVNFAKLLKTAFLWSIYDLMYLVVRQGSSTFRTEVHIRVHNIL